MILSEGKTMHSSEETVDWLSVQASISGYDLDGRSDLADLLRHMADQIDEGYNQSQTAVGLAIGSYVLSSGERAKGKTMASISSEVGPLRPMTQEEWERRQSQRLLHAEWKRVRALFSRLCGEQAVRLFFDMDQWIDNDGQSHDFVRSITVYDGQGEELPFQTREDFWDESLFLDSHLSLREVINARMQEEAPSPEEVQSVVQEVFALWWSEEERLPMLENGRYELTTEPKIDHPLVYIPLEEAKH